MKKKRWRFLYIFLNIIIIAVIGIIDPEIKQMDRLFHNLSTIWVLGGVCSMLLYSLINGMVLNYTTSVIHGSKDFWKCLKISIMGQYYSSITPFAGGGQPAQIYYMRSMGVPGGSASSILIVKFLVYRTVLSIYSVVAFVCKGTSIYKYNVWIFWLAVIGFIINVGTVILLIPLSSNEGFVGKFIFRIIDILYKIRLIKDPQAIKARLKSHVEDFHKGFQLIQGNLKAVFNMGMLTALQLACLFSVTFFIYKAFGLGDEGWISIILVQTFLDLAVSFVPTPGSMGASETGFIAFFRLFFPSNLIFVSMLLWRLISYYFNILAGALIILFDGIRNLVSHNVSG